MVRMIRPAKRRQSSTQDNAQSLQTNPETIIPIQSDLELWDGALAGEQAAWRELVTRYSTLVYNVCTYFGLSYMDAADCFQQTWVLLHRYRKSISDPSRLSAWLVTTAKREALKVKRRAGRFDGLDDSAPIEDTNLLPDKELEAIEARSVIENALQQIDPRCRKLLKLVFYSDEKTSYDELARSLGLSVNAVGPARQRCLARLRKLLEKQGILDALI